MARWDNIAEWVGPTVNRTPGGMREWRGLVEHIAEGSYAGTIAWQKNPGANVSSHFIISKTGHIGQMVDTADAAWTQRDGNGRWLSVENEGFHTGPLTDAQLVANATLFAEGAIRHGYPIQNCNSPWGFGLGHHSMGAENGLNWGHSACPGNIIKNQKTTIVAWAATVHSGDLMALKDDPDFQAMMWRIFDGVVNLRPTYDNHVNNPNEVSQLAVRLQDIQSAANIAATREFPTAIVELTDQDVQRIASQLARIMPSLQDIAEEVAQRLNGGQIIYPPPI